MLLSLRITAMLSAPLAWGAESANGGGQEWILNYGDGKLLEKDAVIVSDLRLELGTFATEAVR